MADINLSIIRAIESGGHPYPQSAVNPKSGAVGMHQIMPKGTRGALDEWNQFHSKENFETKDLYHPSVNYRIADWFYNKRIPQMLKHFKLEDNLDNRIAAYHSGIGNLQKGKLGPEYRNYVAKYKELLKE